MNEQAIEIAAKALYEHKTTPRARTRWEDIDPFIQLRYREIATDIVVVIQALGATK